MPYKGLESFSRWAPVDAAWQDIRYGVRMTLKHPAFSLVTVLSIAIGVGANSGMFSIADTLVLRPLTVPRASEIVTISAVEPRTGFLSPVSSTLSYPEFVDVRDRAKSFASLMAYRLVVAGVAERPDQPTQRRFGMAVSGSFFDAMGAQPAIGRPFGLEEDRTVGRYPVVVLDEDFWRQEFQSDPSIVGRTIRIGGIEMTTIAVMAAGFTGPDQFVQPSYYIPSAMLPGLQNGAPPDERTRRDQRNFVVKGRLKPGVTVAAANEEVRLIGADLARAYPDVARNRGLTVATEFDSRVRARPQLAVMAVMLMTLAVVVLLVACANVAGLLTSRAPVRAREMALRLALGAGRVRLMRQLVVESLVMAIGGGAVGLIIGSGIITMFGQARLSTDVPLKLSFDLNQRVLALGLVVAALSALVSSLVPAWRSTRADLVSDLKAPGATETGRMRLWGRKALVCGQLALSLMLLTMTVFLYRAYQAEIDRGPGFRTDHLLMTTFDPALAGYDAARAQSFYRQLTERARAISGVESVALTSSVHLDQISIENTLIAPEGYRLPEGTNYVTSRSARVDEEFFDTMRIPVVAGRIFRTTDGPEAPRVALVNETFARHYWPGASAVGRRFQVNEAGRPWVEIVGVVANAKYMTLSEAPLEFVYYAQRQRPATLNTLLVRTADRSAALAAPLREVVRTIDRNMPMFEIRTMEDFYATNAVGASGLLVRTIGIMGAMGLALATVGLYGLVAYAAGRRTREIGIRMAVGASAGSVLRMILGQGLLLAACGSLLGVLGSAATNRLMRIAFPFPGVASLDMTTYALVVPALVAVTMVAAYIPASRAARTNPVVALRHD